MHCDFMFRACALIFLHPSFIINRCTKYLPNSFHSSGTCNDVIWNNVWNWVCLSVHVALLHSTLKRRFSNILKSQKTANYVFLGLPRQVHCNYFPIKTNATITAVSVYQKRSKKPLYQERGQLHRRPQLKTETLSETPGRSNQRESILPSSMAVRREPSFPTNIWGTRRSCRTASDTPRKPQETRREKDTTGSLAITSGPTCH